MPSAVWSGHLHFGLVANRRPAVSSCSAKQTERFRRFYRRRSGHVMLRLETSLNKTPVRREDFHFDGAGELGLIGTTANPAFRRFRCNYALVRQVLQSAVTGEEIRQGDLVKGYEFDPNEFAAIKKKEIKAAEIESSETIDLFHFVDGADVGPTSH